MIKKMFCNMFLYSLVKRLIAYICIIIFKKMLKILCVLCVRFFLYIIKLNV
jgi:hypothetical protein